MAENEAGVQLIDLEEMRILLQDGQRIQITGMLDADGNETEDVNVAYRVVGGPRAPSGDWITAVVDNEDRAYSGMEINPRAAIIDAQKNCVTFDSGEVCPLDSWLDERLQPCTPEQAAWVDTFNRRDGYALRISLKPREGLVVLR